MADPIINEVRALLRTFLKSDWKALEVRTDALELFISRDPASRARTRTPAVDVIAPHLGTIADLAAPGTTISAGGVYGKLAVLDEERDLVTECGGIVAYHLKRPGDLVECGEPLLAFSA